MWPPMEGDFSTSTTLWPPLAMSSAAWMPAMPPPSTRARLVTGTWMGCSGWLRLTFSTMTRTRSTALAVVGLALLVHPGAVLAQVGHLAQVGVEPGLGHGAAEGRLVHARRAGRHHHAGELVLLDGLLDHVLARGPSTCTCSPRCGPRRGTSRGLRPPRPHPRCAPMFSPQWQMNTPMRLMTPSLPAYTSGTPQVDRRAVALRCPAR